MTCFFLGLPSSIQSKFVTVCQQPPVSKDAQACQRRVVTALQHATTSPATAFLVTGRMMNVPVEIVLALHQQLWQDIAWAQTQSTKLSYQKIDKVLCVAPCTMDGHQGDDGSSLYVYRYFDDEYLAEQATAHYVVRAPASFSREDVVYLQVLELTLPAYQRAIAALERMVHGNGNGNGNK